MLTYMINKLAKSSITYEGVRRVIDKSEAKGVATSLLGSDKRDVWTEEANGHEERFVLELFQ